MTDRPLRLFEYVEPGVEAPYRIYVERGEGSDLWLYVVGYNVGTDERGHSVNARLPIEVARNLGHVLSLEASERGGE